MKPGIAAFTSLKRRTGLQANRAHHYARIHSTYLRSDCFRSMAGGMDRGTRMLLIFRA
jgi:hypothetical protein